ncbi:MAG: hypothetical protein PHT34_03310 [Oscillospiraceae bacterium]|nr:hypothetical protein [Oscillospiraceae bacterium]
MLVIAGLVCLVLCTATVGTLSCYTTSSEYGIGIVPDSGWVAQQKEAAQAKEGQLAEQSAKASSKAVAGQQDAQTEKQQTDMPDGTSPAFPEKVQNENTGNVSADGQTSDLGPNGGGPAAPDPTNQMMP